MHSTVTDWSARFYVTVHETFHDMLWKKKIFGQRVDCERVAIGVPGV